MMSTTEPTLKEIYSDWAHNTWSGMKCGLRSFMRTRPGIVVAIVAALIIPAVGMAAYLGGNAVADYQKRQKDQRAFEARQQQQTLNFALWSQDMERQQERVDETCGHIYDTADTGYPMAGGRDYAVCKSEIIGKFPVPVRDIGITPRIGVSRW
ncbi:hypothetical protein [Allomesorhizobium camelthorni]|uniref:Uncharacterized protein n=1 Tax=Allomesorhizobium camelthorni TaxID=475069 RepID=A0A6G4W608_9HYPH|nr:hypothetical protein [Mesorhizobium camelthorni]NGO49758.1 hypothetical protein [Mesorhizobium camelthorni]